MKNPYDIMRDRVEEILKYDRDLPSTEHDFQAVVGQSGNFDCRPSNRVGGETRQVFCAFNRPAIGFLSKEDLLNQIRQCEENDIETDRENRANGTEEPDEWPNWEVDDK